ncbi:MAG: tRNA (N(6)-L-threonylcarbamoyladenosine(37)-C(2))-methylthiotransferase MtaB [Clostridiales bacterium]|nr:tRNA (N(6)-L-threonylcarbamoyladenosine(37)-C(2))-methylthiotransferase MtaB [Clostridiales bacterium]
MKKSVATYTLGCRVNQYETDAILDLFKEGGYIIKNFDEYADVYVINTCTVTSLSDRKSRQIIRRAKKNNKNSVVVAVGCYAQAKPDEVSKIDGVDIVVGNNEKSRIVEHVENYMKDKEKKSFVCDIMRVKEYDNLKLSSTGDRTRAFVKIQDGCNNFCSYCIIPYVRGPVRSKDPKLLIKEIEDLAMAGYKEVVLTGIHAASYGKDLGNIDLVDLVYEVYKIEGIERIRFGSLEPKIIDERFIKMFHDLSSKVCNHLHISLQSGCDETLKRMNRKYKALEYKTSVELLRDNVPGILISTDVIVGFPQETDEEFRETYEFLKEINFYKIHVFKYSKRDGTSASKMSGQVLDSVKEKRSEDLIRLSNSGTIKYNRECVGTRVDVLVEKMRADGYYEGLTSNYIRILIESDVKLLRGEIYNVHLKKLDNDGIIGCITKSGEEVLYGK